MPSDTANILANGQVNPRQLLLYGRYGNIQVVIELYKLKMKFTTVNLDENEYTLAVS
jgi:hypothetical protein